MAAVEGPFAGLERLRPALFLGAGLALVAFTASLFLIGVAEVDLQHEYSYRVFSGIGYGLAFLGLLGMYPSLAPERPWLARIGAAFATLGAVMFGLSYLTTGLPGVEFLFGMVEGLALLNFLGLLGGFLFTGLATLGSGAHSRRLGALLVLPSAFFLTNFVQGIALGSNWAIPWLVVGLGGGNTAVMFAVSYTLRSEGRTAEAGRSGVDAAA